MPEKLVKYRKSKLSQWSKSGVGTPQGSHVGSPAFAGVGSAKFGATSGGSDPIYGSGGLDRLKGGSGIVNGIWVPNASEKDSVLADPLRGKPLGDFDKEKGTLLDRIGSDSEEFQKAIKVGYSYEDVISGAVDPKKVEELMRPTQRICAVCGEEPEEPIPLYKALKHENECFKKQSEKERVAQKADAAEEEAKERKRKEPKMPKLATEGSQLDEIDSAIYGVERRNAIRNAEKKNKVE